MDAPSEREAKTEAELALVDSLPAGAAGGRDLAIAVEVDRPVFIDGHVRTVYPGRSGRAEMRRVGEVERLGQQLYAEPLRDLEFAEDTEIKVAVARPAQRVVPDGTETVFVRWDGREREWVKPRLPRPDASRVLHLGLDLVRPLRVSRRIERRARPGDRERNARLAGEDRVDLPAAGEQRTYAAAVKVLAAPAKGQLGHRRPVEVVRAVDTHQGPVQVVELRDLDPRRVVAVVGPGIRNRLRVGVGNVRLEPMGEAPVHRNLQRVVVAASDRADEHRWCRAAEELVERSAREAAADPLRVQVHDTERADLAGGDVAGLPHEAPGELVLHHQVPRLDVAALELIRRQRLDDYVTRHVDDPVAEARGRDRGYTGAELTRFTVRVRRRHNQAEEQRVIGPEGTREVVRVVGDPVAGPDHEVLGHAPRQAEARREHRLRHIYAAVRRDRADAAD